MKTKKLCIAIAASLAFAPALADAHTIAVVVACNAGSPGASSALPSVTQPSADLADATCPAGTYPAASALAGTPALVSAITAAALGGGLALADSGSGNPGSGNPGSGNGSGNPGSGNGSGNPGPGNPGPGNSGSGNSGSGSGNGSGSGTTYPVTAHNVSGLPSPEISSSQLASYPASTSTSPSSAGSSGSSGSGGSSSASSGGGSGGFFGPLLHTVGRVAQQIGHAAVTGGPVNIPIFGTNTTANGDNPANGGGARVGTIPPGTNGTVAAAPAQNLPGTVTMHTIPVAGVHIPQKALDALYNWISVNHTAGNYLNYVLHPSDVTPIVVPVSGGVYEYAKVSGTFDIYIDDGHRHAVRFSGAPVSFTATVPLSGLNDVAQIAEQKVIASSNAIYSGSPQHWNPPGDRSGPFWPSPANGGQRMHLVPGPDRNTDLAAAGEGACTRIEDEFHTSFGTQCWVDHFPTSAPTDLFPAYNHTN